MKNKGDDGKKAAKDDSEEKYLNTKSKKAYLQIEG
jgi:hypothetical protein